MASSFRLNKITIWPPQNAGSDLAYVTWSSNWASFEKDDEKIATLPDGISVPTAMVFVPPKRAVTGFWVSSGLTTENMFIVVCAVGSIIDVDLSWTICNTFVNQSIAGLASVSIGTVYYLALDGASSNKLVPMGLPSTH
jgi:hypothetical protein